MKRILFGSFRKYRISDIIAAREQIDKITLDPMQTGEVSDWEGEYRRVRVSAYHILNAYLEKRPSAMDNVHPHTLGAASVYVAMGEMNRRDALRHGKEYVFRSPDMRGSLFVIGVRTTKNERLRKMARSIRKTLGTSGELWQHLE